MYTRYPVLWLFVAVTESFLLLPNNFVCCMSAFVVIVTMIMMMIIMVVVVVVGGGNDCEKLWLWWWWCWVRVMIMVVVMMIMMIIISNKMMMMLCYPLTKPICYCLRWSSARMEWHSSNRPVCHGGSRYYLQDKWRNWDGCESVSLWTHGCLPFFHVFMLYLLRSN